MKRLRNPASVLSLASILCLLLLAGCTAESPTAPDLNATLEGPALDAAVAEETDVARANIAAKTGNYGAWVQRKDDVLCFLPAVGPNGEIIGLPDVPCSVQVVDTRNGHGNIHLRMKASVPNESGRAVQVTYGNPLPIPCSFPTESGMVSTTKYQFTISRTGHFKGVCHLPD